MRKTISTKNSPILHSVFSANNALINRKNLASPMSEFLGIGVIGALLWYGGKMVLIDQTLSGPVFLSFMLLAYNILTPAKAISKAAYSIKKGDAAAEQVLELLETENEIKEPTQPEIVAQFQEK